MCLIVYRPAGAEFDLKPISNIYSHNPDGAGFMFARKGRVQALKGLWKEDQIKLIWSITGTTEMFFHFRAKTKGDKIKENCHPFQVLDLEVHGRDLWMMHNGTLPTTPIQDNKYSDTWHYVENCMKPLLEANPSLIDQESFQTFLGASIGHNKLVFMDHLGKSIIINKNLGKTQDSGVWLSNKYSLAPKKASAYQSSYYHSKKWNPVTKTWDHFDSKGEYIHNPYSTGYYYG